MSALHHQPTARRFTCLSDAIEAVGHAQHGQELRAINEAVEEGFWSGSLQVSDEEWPRFNDAIAARLVALAGGPGAD